MGGEIDEKLSGNAPTVATSAASAKPVYNKTQYPRIFLSCIFNDFLGDFGKAPRLRKEVGASERKGTGGVCKKERMIVPRILNYLNFSIIT
jgi:hypothetical protein